MEMNDELFMSLADNLHDGVYLVDRDRVIQFWSKGAERISGYGREEVIGHSCAESILVHVNESGEYLCSGPCPLAETMWDGTPRRCRIFLKHKEGHRVPVRVYAAPVKDPSGAIIGGVESFYDDSKVPFAIEEVETLKRELYQCPLTRIPNRRYADEIMPAKYADLLATKHRAGILFLDIDLFKQYNDLYGHHIGDIVLKMVAQTVSHTLREVDVVARWGGEEFIALLPLSKAGELEAVAERLRVLIRRSSLNLSKTKLSVTVSVGALDVADTVSWEKAWVQANMLMHESKEHGRNRVSLSEISPHSTAKE